MGHRGASALAPENTLDAFALAVELGCDMLEFDVLRRRDGTLVLAHSLRAYGPDLPTLDEALVACAERFPRVGLQLDLKARGIEKDVAESLRQSGVRDRAWVSGFDSRILRRFAEVDPELPRSYTLPRDRLGVARATLPRRLPALLARARASAVTLHESLASHAAIERAHDLGAAVYVWTVNDAQRAQTLVAAEADGIITDDPRIFATVTT